MIIAKLLRKDIAGIGKQEIKTETPILGKVLELGGTIFIDRANAKSAIDAMLPLVDAMKNEGKSVVLAPEGTRTVSPKLAPFKKGAFHLAMQAGVPIIPIVIRNAGDVAPKGDFVFRPATVDVQVLPPVDTSDWKVSGLRGHVRDVRNMFARALGQPEEMPSGSASLVEKPAAKPTKPAKTKPKTKAKPKAKAAPKAKAKKSPKAKASPARKKPAAKKAGPKTRAKARTARAKSRS